MKKIFILAIIVFATSCERANLEKKQKELLSEFEMAGDSLLHKEAWLKYMTPVEGDTTLRNLNVRFNKLNVELTAIAEKLK